MSTRLALFLPLALLACGSAPEPQAEEALGVSEPQAPPPAPVAPAPVSPAPYAPSTPPAPAQLVDGEWVGPLNAAEPHITLTSTAGAFTIDAFEASLDGAKAVSRAGVAPAAGLTWHQAKDACEAAGKRLCSEEEWLVACTGKLPADRDGDGDLSDDPIQGRKYPYGPASVQGYCASSRTRDSARPLITGDHPRCVTPDGVYDLEGVTKEWVGVTPDRAAVKGGSYYSRGSARCGYWKNTVALDTSDPSIGFRCCSGPLPESGEPQGVEGARLGDEVKDFELPTLDGGTVTMASLRGKPTILTFWASWCGPCRAEIPALHEEYSIYASEGLQIIAINVDTNLNAAKGFMTTTPIRFPVLLDTDNAVRNALGASTLPTTIYVGRDGRIRQRTTGYDAKHRAELAANVTALMAAE